MLRRSLALRVLAVVVTGALGLMTGLVTASALSGTMEDPDVLAVEDTAGADGCIVADAADAADDDDDDSGDDCTQDGVVDDDTDSDSGDEAGSDDDSDDADDGESHGKRADDGDEPVAGDDASHGAAVSAIAHDTEPGPGHGLAVCRVASGGKCQPNEGADEATGDDSGEEAGHGSRGRGQAKAAEAKQKKNQHRR